MKRWFGAAVLGLLAASSAWPQATQVPDTPERLIGNLGDPDYSSCFDLVKKPDAPTQTACYVTGTVTRFGEVVDAKPTCDKPIAGDRVAQCAQGLRLAPAYLGYEGPVCVAMLFDVRAGANGSLKPNELRRSMRIKEVYPCEGREAPPTAQARADAAPGPIRRAPTYVENGVCMDGAQKVETKAICVARAGIDTSGAARVEPQAVCSDPKITSRAVACVKAHRLKSYEGERPSELCLHLQYFGPKLLRTPGLDGGSRMVETQMSKCPPGFF
jgi:hypothetical protein